MVNYVRSNNLRGLVYLQAQTQASRCMRLVSSGVHDYS